MAAPQETGFVQDNYEIGSWQVGDSPKVLLAVLSIQDSIGNRIIQHKRPYREGAKLDDLGAEPRTWSVQLIFNNDVLEPGISASGILPFPDAFRQLQESFEFHETGNLVLPGLGFVRARARTMSSEETFEERDTARCTVVWEQDNEEALDRTLLRPPTARATAVRAAEHTVFTAQSLGAWDGDLNGLVEFAAEVEGLLLAPGRAANAVETQVRRNRRAIERIVEAQNQLARDVGLETDQPRGSSFERQSVLLRDRQAQLASERAQGRPRTRPFRVDVAQTSIFEIAARVNQDAEELLDLNDGRIANPFRIQRGTVVLVFRTTPRA